MNKKDFDYEKSDSIFLNKLPTQLFYKDYENIHNKLIDANANIVFENYKEKDPSGFGFWETNSKEKDTIHSIMKPVMHNILYNALNESNITQYKDDYIIHFRCADTPFIKHPGYHFQKYKYFKKCLEPYNNINEILILSCNDHLSNENDKESCNIYVNKLKDFISSINYKAKTECNSNVVDFAKMFFAKLVISTGSSFSFMAGYFGNGDFIQPEINNTCNGCNNMYIGYNIDHSEVDDYHNIDDVYKLLTQ
jgi:hypothetical protein